MRFNLQEGPKLSCGHNPHGPEEVKHKILIKVCGASKCSVCLAAEFNFIIGSNACASISLKDQ